MLAPVGCTEAGNPRPSIRSPHDLLLHREETHPQELRQARGRAGCAVPARHPDQLVRRVPPGRSPGGQAQGVRPAVGLPVGVPDLQPFGQRPPGVRELRAGRAAVRRGRVPAARPHLRQPAARQGAPHDHGPRGHQAHDEGGEGAGGLHGRDPAHDPQRLLRHQRHRARDRLAAAPLAGRVLRARPRQDALLRQAAVLGARDSLPRLVARLRVRPQGLPVLPRRPPPQDAGDDPAEGARLQARADPRAVLRVRHLPRHQEGHRVRGGARAPARRDRALRHHHQGRQGHRPEGQAHHREAHPRDGSRGHEEARRRARLPARPRARQERWSTRRPARSSPTPTTRSPRRC